MNCTFTLYFAGPETAAGRCGTLTTRDQESRARGCASPPRDRPATPGPPAGPTAQRLGGPPRDRPATPRPPAGPTAQRLGGPPRDRPATPRPPAGPTAQRLGGLAGGSGRDGAGEVVVD